MKTGKASARGHDAHRERTNSSVRDTSVFDFSEKDPRPFRGGKRKKAAAFRRAFKSKSSPSPRVKHRSISVLTGKSTSKAKRKNRKQQGRQAAQKPLSFQCQQDATAQEAVSYELPSGSDKTKNDDADSNSEGEVGSTVQDDPLLREPFLKSGCGLEKLLSSIDASAVEDGSFAEKVTEVVIRAEVLFPWEGVCMYPCCFTFTADAIKLKILGGIDADDRGDVIKQWSLNDINSFGSYQQAGYALLELGLIDEGAKALVTAFEETPPFEQDGYRLLAKINYIDWPEQERQITSLSDRYKSLWRPLKEDTNISELVERFQRWSGPEFPDRQECVRGEHWAGIGDENGFSFPIEKGRPEVRLQGWVDIVYPKGDHDAVTVTENDFQLLNPEEFLSDTIIDFYIKHLQTTLLEEDKKRFYFFNSFFFRKLTEIDKNLSCGPERHKAAFEGVKRWTARFNIFEKDYLFVPIMQSAHWSLIIICHPGCISADDEETSFSKTSVILHLDSLKGCHTGLEEPIRNYLMDAWIQKYGDCNSLACKRFSEMKFISAEVPQQTNYSDCGLFLLHYVELFIRQVQGEELLEFVTSEWFNPADVSIKRSDIQGLIIELHAKESVERGIVCESSCLQDSMGLIERDSMWCLNGDSVVQGMGILENRNLAVVSGAVASSTVFNANCVDNPVELEGGSIGLDLMESENQICSGTFNDYDGLQHRDSISELYPGQGFTVFVPSFALGRNYCCNQLGDSLGSCNQLVMLCPCNSLEATNDSLHCTRLDRELTSSQPADISSVCVDINTDSATVCMDGKADSGDQYHGSNHACRFHVSVGMQEIVDVDNDIPSLDQVVRHGTDYMQQIPTEMVSQEIWSGSNNCRVDNISNERVLSVHVSEQSSSAIDDYVVENTQFLMSTTERCIERVNSRLCTGQGGTVQESGPIYSSPTLEEQSMVASPKSAVEEQSKDELKEQFPVEMKFEEDESLQDEDHISKTNELMDGIIAMEGVSCALATEEFRDESRSRKDDTGPANVQDSNLDGIIATEGVPCALAEEEFRDESLSRKDYTGPANVQESNLDDTQYISSDEDASGSDNRVQQSIMAEKILLEAARARKQTRRRKKSDGSESPQITGRGPVTRSAKKSLNEKPERSSFIRYTRKRKLMNDLQ